MRRCLERDLHAKKGSREVLVQNYHERPLPRDPQLVWEETREFMIMVKIGEDAWKTSKAQSQVSASLERYC